MVPETAPNLQANELPDWEAPSPPTDLIFDDGEPLESNRHRIAMNVLIRSAQQALLSRPDSFVGGNMFVYYSRNQSMNRDFRGPDFFAVLGVEANREELLSPSTAVVDRGVKKDLYEQVFRTPDYFVFDLAAKLRELGIDPSTL